MSKSKPETPSRPAPSSAQSLAKLIHGALQQQDRTKVAGSYQLKDDKLIKAGEVNE